MKKKVIEDFNQSAFRAIQHTIELAEGSSKVVPIRRTKGKNPAAVELGRLGGLKGGNARRDKLSPERRREIASTAARKRWAKKPQT